MGRKTKKEEKDRISQSSRGKQNDETKAEKKSQGFSEITRICSLSRFLNNSFSPLVASKISEYRLNDSSLTVMSDRQIIQVYIGKLVEFRSKMAYFAGIRGSLFFAFLYEELQNATNDNERDEIWKPILDKNGKSIITTLFYQLCNPNCKKSRFKIMQRVIDVCNKNGTALLNALDIDDITKKDVVSSSLSSIYSSPILLQPLASNIQKDFCNNLSEEHLPTLKKRISFLVDKILTNCPVEVKKKSSPISIQFIGG